MRRCLPNRPPRSVMRSLLPLALALASCTGTPDGVAAVTGFELERYLGTWYEIARLDHRFERGLTDVTATYRPRAGGGIEVVNRGFDADGAEWKEARGKAFFLDDERIGALKVSFFGPFYGGYNVIALDDADYAWSMVAGPNRDYLWILARTSELDPAIIERLVSEAAALGFPVHGLIRVSHGRVEGGGRDGGDR